MRTKYPWDGGVLLLLVLLVHLSMFTSIQADDCVGAESTGCDCESEGGRSRMQCDFTALTTIPFISSDVTELQMTRNTFQQLPNNSFNQLTKIQTMRFELCSIETIELEAFSSLYTLQTLEITINEIKTLPNYVFKDLNSLERLVLSRNIISQLTTDVFDGLANVKHLDLSYNKLSSLPADVFDKLPSLTELNLQVNAISVVPASVFSLNPKLRYMDFSRNKIQEIHPKTYNNTPTINNINYENNELTTIDGEAFTALNELQMLNLKDNVFICDCLMSGFRQWITQSNLQWSAEQSGECGSPAEHKGKFILNLTPENFVCTTTTTTTTTTTPAPTAPKSTATEQPTISPAPIEEEPANYPIIIGCSVAGGVILILLLCLAIYYLRRKKKSRMRQVKYILRPGLFDHLPKQSDKRTDKQTKNGSRSYTNRDSESKSVIDTNSLEKDAREFEGSYRPNIPPVDTDIDYDNFSDHGYNSYQRYNNAIDNEGSINGGLGFYNSLNRSIIARSSHQVTPISTLQRATPLNIAYINRQQGDTPVLYEEEQEYLPPNSPDIAVTNNQQSNTPWRDNMAYRDDRQYDFNGVYPGDTYTSQANAFNGFPIYFNGQFANDNYRGKQSGDGTDSGVHSNGSAPHMGTPTEYLDNHSPIIINDDHIALSGRKIIKNDTYV